MVATPFACLALGIALAAGSGTDAGPPAAAPPLRLPNALDASLDRAARSLARGDYAQARSLAESTLVPAADPTTSGRARLIAGVAARGLGDFEGAAALLQVASPALGPLEAYRLAYLGDSRFYAGDSQGAADAFAQAETAATVEPFRRRVTGRLADALLDAGHACEAAQALVEAKHPESAAERLDTLARAQRACGELAAAKTSEHQLWLDFPEHPAGEALEAQEGANAAVPDRLRRAARLLLKAEPARALDEAALGLTLRPEAVPRSHLELVRGKALLELGERPAALLAFQAAAKAAPRSDAGREAGLLLARAAWRDGKIADAEARFQKLAATSDHVGDEAAFLYGFIAFDRAEGKAAGFTLASQRFQAFLNAHPHSHRADEATWFAAFAAYRAGAAEEAHELFTQLATNFPTSPLQVQGLYWEARTSERADAERLYREVIRLAPLGYYAAEARQRLAELKAEPEPVALRAEVPSIPTAPTGSLEALAVALDGVGLSRERSEALEAAAWATHGEDPSYRLATVAAGLGEWGRAYALANGRLWHKALEERDPGALALLYPRAYRSSVESAAASIGFDPAFVWAIMRRESAFDPGVESAARAVGLMQLLLPTAQKIAGLLDDPPPESDDLHLPEREIPIAVWYLAELAGRFSHAGLAAAAYNAGPAAVSSWVQRDGTLPFDVFVETIPFRETRLYVKNVLGDYLTYRTLYPEPTPPLSTASTLEPAKPGADF